MGDVCSDKLCPVKLVDLKDWTAEISGLFFSSEDRLSIWIKSFFDQNKTPEPPHKLTELGEFYNNHSVAFGGIIPAEVWICICDISNGLLCLAVCKVEHNTFTFKLFTLSSLKVLEGNQ